MLDADDVYAWGKAFLLTEAIEAPIYRWLFPTTFRRGLLASAITHPFVWFAFPWAGDRIGASYAVTAVASEVFAWAVEAAFFRAALATTWGRAARVSLVANGASVALGLTLRATLGIV